MFSVRKHVKSLDKTSFRLSQAKTFRLMVVLVLLSVTFSSSPLVSDAVNSQAKELTVPGGLQSSSNLNYNLAPNNPNSTIPTNFNTNNSYTHALLTDTEKPAASVPVSNSKSIRHLPQKTTKKPLVLPDPNIPLGARKRAIEQRSKIPVFVPTGNKNGNPQPKSAAPTPWTSLGPAPTDSLSNAGRVSGRVTTLAYDNTNNIIYAGAADGGVWKSADNGSSWIPLIDDQPTQAIGAIGLDPTNLNIIYAGTGEDNFNGDAVGGIGILKSVNGGKSWRLLPQTDFPYYYGIYKIVVDPNAASHIFAATDQGLWTSVDSGNSWSQALGSFADGYATITDLVIDASTNPSTVYAARGKPYYGDKNGIYKSTDGGSHFSLLGNAPNGSAYGRIAIGIAPANHLQLYMVISSPSNNTCMGMWSSSNGGATWVQTTLSGEQGGPALFSDDLGLDSQGQYDMFLAVDPVMSGTVYVGGVNVFKTTDGGATFNNLTNVNTYNNTIHADQHVLVFFGSNVSGQPRPFYVGNDGGVYSSLDGGQSWLDNNTNLSITQFYAGSATNNFNVDKRVWGGTQDNGTQLYDGSGGIWYMPYGGDGGFTASDPTNPNIAYAENFYLNIRKTTDGGNTWYPSGAGINGSDSKQLIAPFVMDSSNPNRLLAGTNHLYETTDAANNWHEIGPATNAGSITAISIAPSVTSTIYIGTDEGAILVTRDDGLHWSDVSTGIIPSYVQATALAVSPTNPFDVVATFAGYASFSGRSNGTHVYRSTDGGSHWIDLSTNLPDIPFTSVVRNPTNPDVLYVSSRVGFFLTFNSGKSWYQYQFGLPDVLIEQLFTDLQFTTIFAATHGRGMYALPTSVLDTASALDRLTSVPIALNFSAVAGSSIPPVQSVVLTTSIGPINYSTIISYSSAVTGWLTTTTPVTGTVTPGSPVIVSITPTTTTMLSPGVYSATVIYTDNNDATDKASTTVTYTVSPPPVLAVTPANLDFSITQGSSDYSSLAQVVTLTATANPISYSTSITYSAGVTTAWLSLIPNAGTVTPGLPMTVTANITNSNLLASGNYTATVTFTDNTNSLVKTQLIAHLLVIPTPQFTVIPTTLTFQATTDGNSATSQILTLTALYHPINWTTSIDYGGATNGWLNYPNPSSGTVMPGTPVIVTVNVYTANLAAGTYTATLTFQDTFNPADSAKTRITLMLTSPTPTPPITTITPSPTTPTPPTTTTPSPTTPTVTSMPTPTPTTPGGGNTSYTYNLPLLANRANTTLGNTTTFITFQNLSGSQSANVTVQYYGLTNGNNLNLNDTLQLPPRGQKAILPAIVTGTNAGGIVTSDQPLNVVVSEALDAGGSAYNVSGSTAATLYSPLALNGQYNFQTSIVVFNGAALGNATGQILFFDDQGRAVPNATRQFNIPPHASQIFNQADSNSGLGANHAYWAKIVADNSNASLSVQVIEFGPANFVATFNAIVPGQVKNVLYAPATFNGQFNFVTGMAIANPNAAIANITISYYDTDGKLLLAQRQSIASNGVIGVFQPGVTGLSNTVSSAVISSDQALIMTINERGPGAIAGTYVGIATGSQNVSLPVMANGFAGFVTGATILNTSLVNTANLTLTYLDANDQPIGRPQTKTLAPNASFLVYQGDAAQNLPNNFFGTAIINSDQPLLVTTNAFNTGSQLFYTYTEPGN